MSEPTLRLLSLGAGVQSTTLALLAAHGELPGLDGAIFADTGWEPRAVYEHLNRLEQVLAEAGIPLYRVSFGNLRDDSLTEEAILPLHIRKSNGVDILGQRECTGEYKIRPLRRKIRALLGAKAPDFMRVPKGRVAELWIGFSLDEVRRISDKKSVLYIRNHYPLLDLGMDRKACERWLRAHGWNQVAKSACIGCPLHGNRQWRELRDNHPDEWADAVEFDAAIRSGGARRQPLKGQAFLHASRTPLDQAPIDWVTRTEWKDRQFQIFDQFEDGDPDGCSPHGCRSGQPVPVPLVEVLANWNEETPTDA